MSTITELLIPQQETGGPSSRLKVGFDQKSEQERTVVEYHHISFCSVHKCTNKQLFHRIFNMTLSLGHSPIKFTFASFLSVYNPQIILETFWTGLSSEGTLSNLDFEPSIWNCGQNYWIWARDLRA